VQAGEGAAVAVRRNHLFLICSVVAIFIALDVPAVAQHPALAWSTPIPGQPVLVDAAGNVYAFSGSPLMMTKFGPDGAVLSTSTFGVGIEPVAIDSAGNLYIAFYCGDSGPCPAPTTLFGTPAANTRNAFVGKVAPSGTSYAWLVELAQAATSFQGRPLAIDSAGNVYVTGSASCGFAATAGSYQSTCDSTFPNIPNGFAAKIDPSGTKLLYATFLNGVSVVDMAVDSSGSVYLTGVPWTTFTATAGAYETNPTATTYSFVTKLKPDGSGAVYSTFFSGANANAISADAAGNAYVSGYTVDSHFPVTQGAAETTPPFPPLGVGGPESGFITKFNATGSSLAYSTYTGLLSVPSTAQRGGGSIGVTHLAVDAAGNAYATAITTRRGAPVLNAIQADLNDLQTPFDPTQAGDLGIVKLNPQGSSVLFSTYLGGADSDWPSGLNVIGDGSIYVFGSSVWNTFPWTSGASNFTYFGFLAKIAPSGQRGVPTMAALQRSMAGSPVGGLQIYFPNAILGSSSTLLFYLSNYGAAPMAVNSITATGGQFSQTNDCPATLAIGTHCTITGKFTPTVTGVSNGSIAANTDAGTVTFLVFGPGLAPSISFSQTSLTFGAQAVGTSSAPQSIKITNTGTSALHVSTISVQGDFAQSNDCGGGVTPNASCTLSVVFTPTVTGQRSGSVTLTDDAAGSPHVITLTGGGPPDFAMGAASGGSMTGTVTAGQAANYSLSLTPSGGFSGTVTLTCSGAPTAASCAVNPASVNVSGAAAAPFTVSVTTTSRTAGASVLPRPTSPAGWMIVLLFGGLASAWFARLRKRLMCHPTLAKGRRGWGILGMLAVLALMVACGGGSSSTKPPVQTGTPAGTYTIVVSATSGSTTHTQNLTLTVN
jgi:hypothetical protein